MKKTIVATEQDGLETRSITIDLEILDESIDVVEACKEAAREYVATQEGLKTFLYNCSAFNWGDFASEVPNEICEKHGFRKIDTDTETIDVYFDEQLVDEPTFLVTDIEWDVDEEEDNGYEDDEPLNLPTEYYLPLCELLDDGENIGDVDIEELKDRIADYLSDNYGFCIRGFAVE